MIHNDDCINTLKILPDACVDSLVTDPPAGISFMNKSWDDDKGGRDAWVAWMCEIMQECLRVLKPGAHALVWSIPRTSHWTTTALEDAGFEIRDVVTHLFSTGFPKSLNIKKSAEKKVISCQCDIYTTSDELSDLPQESKKSIQELRSKVLQSQVLRDKQAPCSAQDKDMSGLREGMDAQNSGATDSQQNMQSCLHGEDVQCGPNGSQIETGREMPILSQGILDPKQSTLESQILFNEMRRCNTALKPGVCCSPSGDCTQYEGAGRDTQVRPCQSIMEGRSDVQAQQGQLHRAEIHSMPIGFPADGAEGRLHHGAPPHHGDAPGPSSDPHRSSASPRSQHAQQSDIESGMVRGQPVTQTCRRCGKPRIEKGLGTALKPAAEFWILARKPISEKTVAANVLKWGTGGINIERIGEPV